MQSSPGMNKKYRKRQETALMIICAWLEKILKRQLRGMFSSVLWQVYGRWKCRKALCRKALRAMGRRITSIWRRWDKESRAITARLSYAMPAFVLICLITARIPCQTDKSGQTRIIQISAGGFLGGIHVQTDNFADELAQGFLPYSAS